MRNNIKKLRKTGFALIILFAALVLFLVTNPQSVPSYLLIVPFILLYILFLDIFNTLLMRNIRSLNSKSNRKRLYLAGTIAALPVILLALQSIGQLTARDAITLVVLIFVLGFYVNRVSFGDDPAKHS
jgi:hypothetical protein